MELVVAGLSGRGTAKLAVVGAVENCACGDIARERLKLARVV